MTAAAVSSGYTEDAAPRVAPASSRERLHDVGRGLCPDRGEPDLGGTRRTTSR
ncbi:hypothetical protein [Saccharothrix sp. Mg75]|uniref:hypothetical protein n=1 Tax=Saccharothrix sp. Mg75 TaxID=3445357 RepID=UPI003EEC5564